MIFWYKIRPNLTKTARYFHFIVHCFFPGFISSYFFMSTFLSMNVIGFEIWITFKKVRVENNPHNDKKRYLIYAIYVWTVPIVFYLLYYLTLSKLLQIYKYYKNIYETIIIKQVAFGRRVPLPWFCCRILLHLSS